MLTLYQRNLVNPGKTALLLWESCCIPRLLYGAGTWVQINSETEKRLNRIQCWFVRLLLKVGPGSPVSALLWDTNLLDTGLQIFIEKAMIVIHISSLEKDTLASRIYEEQRREKLPGLARETEEICRKLNVEDCNITRMGKADYRKLITSACHKKNEESIRA